MLSWLPCCKIIIIIDYDIFLPISFFGPFVSSPCSFFCFPPSSSFVCHLSSKNALNFHWINLKIFHIACCRRMVNEPNPILYDFLTSVSRQQRFFGSIALHKSFLICLSATYFHLHFRCFNEYDWVRAFISYIKLRQNWHNLFCCCLSLMWRLCSVYLTTHWEMVQIFLIFFRASPLGGWRKSKTFWFNQQINLTYKVYYSN